MQFPRRTSLLLMELFSPSQFHKWQRRHPKSKPGCFENEKTLLEVVQYFSLDSKLSGVTIQVWLYFWHYECGSYHMLASMSVLLSPLVVTSRVPSGESYTSGCCLLSYFPSLVFTILPLYDPMFNSSQVLVSVWYRPDTLFSQSSQAVQYLLMTMADSLLMIHTFWFPVVHTLDRNGCLTKAWKTSDDNILWNSYL